MTHEEALKYALDSLHKIASGIVSRQLVGRMNNEPNRPRVGTPLYKSLAADVLGDDEIEKLALDTWEAIVTNVEPRLPNTTIFECSPGDGVPGQGDTDE